MFSEFTIHTSPEVMEYTIKNNLRTTMGELLQKMMIVQYVPSTMSRRTYLSEIAYRVNTIKTILNMFTGATREHYSNGLQDYISECYTIARFVVVNSMGEEYQYAHAIVKNIPETCMWTVEDLISLEFMTEFIEQYK